MGKVIHNKRISAVGTPIQSPHDVIPTRRVPHPEVFTFDEPFEDGDNCTAESVISDGDPGFFSSPHLDGIESVRDSLSVESSTPFRRLSIQELVRIIRTNHV